MNITKTAARAAGGGAHLGRNDIDGLKRHGHAAPFDIPYPCPCPLPRLDNNKIEETAHV